MGEPLRNVDLGGKGLKCGHCGSALRKCDETIDGQNGRIRYRYCRACGKKNTCLETVIGFDDVRTWKRKT